MNKIFLAIDGSDHAKKAIAKASDLSKLSGGEVRVFHFQDRELTKSGVAVNLEISADAKELVDSAVAELQGAGIKVSGETRAGLHGGAAKAIVDGASDFGADLIVMGSRGLSDFQALLLGSVAHKVVHYAHCPVLVVR
jgi:nucleotide-binding universal stress UspA family protein